MTAKFKIILIEASRSKNIIVIYTLACIFPLILCIGANLLRTEEKNWALFLTIHLFSWLVIVADYILAFFMNALSAIGRQEKETA